MHVWDPKVKVLCMFIHTHTQIHMHSLGFIEKVLNECVFNIKIFTLTNCTEITATTTTTHTSIQGYSEWVWVCVGMCASPSHMSLPNRTLWEILIKWCSSVCDDVFGVKQQEQT